MALPQRYVGNAQKEFYTEAEYFEFSQTAEERWEFTPFGPPQADGSRLGVIRAMSGGTDDHAAIISNVARALGNALVPKGCRVYVSDMRIHTGDGKNTFPDVAVVCGPRQYHQGRTDALTNPTLIVEVLSASTQGYDRSEKFDHYQTIPTLTDYLLVWQDQARALLHTRRDDDHWDLQIVAGLERGVYLPSVDVTLALSDVYTLIDFAEEQEEI